MNEIAKENIKTKLETAIKVENLLNQDVAAIFGIHHCYMSWFKNPKYWDKISDTVWERVCAWVNSGQSLKEYSEKHGKVLPEPKVHKPKEGISYKPEVKDRIKSIKPKKSEPPRLRKGVMVDLLLEEKELLKCKIETIDTLLKYYIS